MSFCWYEVNKTNGARTALGFTSAAAFNDISEGSFRSAGAVVGILRRRKKH